MPPKYKPDSFQDTRPNLSVLDIAKDYLERGWQPIPNAYRKKKPSLDEWQKLELTEATLPKYFNGAQQNVGVQLGPRSKGLTDIDLDCPEAIQLAPRYLPKTLSCFGRASKPLSHFLYYIDDAPDKAAVQHKDIDGKKSIIELRIGGGPKGAQTIFPGSTHESGEPIEWAFDREPARSTFEELKTAVSKIAVGVLLMRHWPQRSGHAAALALGGFLARAGWSEDEIEKIVKLVVRDPKWRDDSVRTAKGSVEALAKGEKVQGLPSLREQFGDEPAKAIAKILEYGAENADGFAVGSNGIPHPTQGNIRLALEKLEVKVRHNLFEDRPIVEGLAGFELLDDRAMDRLWLTIDEKYKFRPSKEFFWTVVFDEAYRNCFHPVREYLDSLQWDGVKRIDTWLVDYAGAEASEFVCEVGALMLVAAVRRVRSPGCKFDEMPVLQSVQGFNKSTALSILAVKPEWFSDDLPLNADSKKTIERLRGRWIVEAAELKGMRYGDIEHLKAFLSRSVDRARMSYDRANTELKRQCVIIGTTNHEKFLRDQTGNRRFWPVRDVKFDLDKLKQDRDQLWAEAAAREAEGASIRLPPELWSNASQQQEEHTIGEPWIETIQNVLGDIKGKILNTDAWLLVGMTPEKRTQAHNERLGIAMRACGWERRKCRFGKLGPCWGYVPSGTEKGEELQRVLVFHDWREGTTEVRLAVDDDDDGRAPF
jgi:hypothetical protein